MKLLFITHETSRTGAPMVLLYFLKWLQVNKPEVVVDVLALTGGDLEEEFKNVCHAYFNYQELTQSKPLLFLQRQLLKLKLYKRVNLSAHLITSLSKNNYDIIYANSAPSLPIAASLKKQAENSKLLFHVHELEVVLNSYLNKKDNALSMVDKFVAASGIVKTNLAYNWGVEKENIEVVYEFSKIADITLKKQSKHFIVGASGTVESRKGVDAFLQVARLVNKKMPNANIEFVWVGRNDNDYFVQSDVEKMNLSKKVTFTGEQEKPHDFFKDFDVFLMISREDPFPLVCIEVANLKKPIVCFEGATGTQEILINGGGYIVPYLDVELMAEKVMFYYNNQSELILDGEKAQQLFSEFTPEKGCPLIYDIINSL
jgi:glycosyltransferase involved in cell wall biosynthesis